MVQVKRLVPIIFIAISGLITISPLSADTLYRSEMDDGLWGEGYRGGGRSYQSLPDNDIYRNTLFQGQKFEIADKMATKAIDELVRVTQRTAC